MKVTLESTERIVELEMNGNVVPARVWIGRTENGIECHAYITRIAVGRDDDASEFERDLREAHVQLPPVLDRAIPARLIL
jgi:hypothetical protein